jgi:hypothetical protein
MHISNIPILLCVISLIGESVAATINYCHDDEVNRDWEKLVLNHKEPEIGELYRLRKDLCKKVDQGEMKLDEAIDIFETQRQIKIKVLKQRKLQIQDSSSSSG